MEDDYQINEQDQWSQSPSHSKTHYNYISSDSSLCIVWMTTKNIRSINGIWYEMLKRSIGAIYNVNQSIAEVITGQPLLSIWNKMNSIKHYLKTFQQSGVFRKRRVHGLYNQKIEWLPRINNRKRFERRGSLPGVEKNRTPGVFY